MVLFLARPGVVPDAEQAAGSDRNRRLYEAAARDVVGNGGRGCSLGAEVENGVGLR